MKELSQASKNENSKCIVKNIRKCLTGIVVALMIIITGMPSQKVEAESVNLKNPQVLVDTSLASGQKVTWDCVWFGSYPQSEIMSSDAVYATLESADAWDSNNDITIDGIKYRRIKSSDATYVYSTTSTISAHYDWTGDAIYHYFKYEPIKWRVLNVENGQAFLLADIALDDQMYNDASKFEAVTWESSTIRSWLNGYESEKNQTGIDYTSKNFIDAAFIDAEQKAIKSTTVINDTEGENNTQDKIFLLSNTEVFSTDEAVSYGFTAARNVADNARRRKSSTYAKAMGVNTASTGLSISTVTGEDLCYQNCMWWLRSGGSHANYFAARVYYSGSVTTEGDYANTQCYAVCPALNLELSSLNQYSYAGTVCSDGTKEEVPYQKAYTVTYNGNGDDVRNIPEVQIKENGLSLILSDKKPIRTNYTFLGWAKTASASKAEYQLGEEYNINADLTLYAIWEPVTYKITYNANEGNGAPAIQNAVYGSTVNLSTTVPQRSGYTFQGWSEQNTGTIYQAGASYRITGNATLYAVWKVETGNNGS
ncbi:MAG: InlB B-repeat-containing protein, partial [Lachnospiraceae bacterium]|nr:InlB B-repeat-containing protein [Lachnospiraceae bacterium]